MWGRGHLPFNPIGSKCQNDEGTLKDLREPDDELLEKVRNAPEGDYRAFEQLVLRHQKRVVEHVADMCSPGRLIEVTVSPAQTE